MQPVDVSWLVRLRWAAAVLFLLLALAARSVFHIPVPPLAVGVVWGVQILSNVALGLRVRTHRTVQTTTVAALMALDTLLLTVLLALSGGPSNPFSVLYLVDVALGAVVLSPALTWALLGLVLFCFGALFLPIPWSLGATIGHAELMQLHLRGMWVAFALAGCTLVAFVLRVRRALADREAELSRERERAQRRERLASLATLAAGTAHALGSPLSTIAVAAHELERRLRALPEAAEDARLIREQVARCREALARMSTEAGQSPGEMLHPRPVSLLLDEALEGLPEPRRVLIELQDGVREATAALPVRAVGQSRPGAGPQRAPGLSRRAAGAPSPRRRRRPAAHRGGGPGRRNGARGASPRRRAVFQHPRLGPRAGARALRGPEPGGAARWGPASRLRARAGNARLPHRAPGAGDMTSLSILLVDDDENFRERMARALRDRGHELRTASGPDDAIRMATEDSPECAVVDLRMPGGSGLDVVSALRTIDPATTVVVLTGYGSIATATEAVRRGALHYLQKPVDADELLTAFARGGMLPADELPEEPAAPSLARAEWEHIQRVLADAGGNVSEAARRLGLHRKSLQRKMQKHPPRR